MGKYESYIPSVYDWLGDIPSHWKEKSIRGITKISSERLGGENLPLLSVYREYGVILKNSRDDNHNVESNDLSNYKIVYKNYLVLNKMKMWQGSLGISKYDGIVSPAYIVCKISDESINVDFLHFLLRTVKYKTYYNQYSYGVRVGQWDMHYDDFKNMRIYIPPRAEQDQIVRFLDWKVSEINKLINIEKQKLTILREMLDSKFQDISLSSEEKISLKRLVSLDNEFVDIDSSAFYQKAGMYNRGRGIFLREPVLGSDMGDSLFQVIHANRLMISGQFAWEDAVYITAKKDEAGLASHRYYLLKSTNGNVPVEYLFGYFLSLKGLSDLQRCSHGAAGRNRPLNINELLRIKIPIINDKNNILSFSKIVHAYMEMRPIVLAKEQLFNELKNTIISDVVTGKIDVRNVTIPEYEHIDDTADAASGEESAEELVEAEEMEA